MRQVPDERGHPVQSEVIKRNQSSSSATDGMPDERGHPVQSEVISRNQMPSVVISGHHAPMMAFVLNSPAADACGVPSTARPVGVTPINESAVLVTEQGLPKPERGSLRRVRVLGHIERIEAVTKIDARTCHLEAL